MQCNYDRKQSPLPEYSLNDSIYSGSTTGLVREGDGTSTLTQDAQFTNPLYELEKNGMWTAHELKFMS